MRLIIGVIVVLFVIGKPALAETDEEAKELERHKRILEELRESAERRRVKLVDKGPDWTRYIFDNRELVIDGTKGIDLSDQGVIDLIVDSVRGIRRYEKTCDVVYRFKHKSIPDGVGGITPKTETHCRSGCFHVWESEKVEYGRSKRTIHMLPCRYSEF